MAAPGTRRAGDRDLATAPQREEALSGRLEESGLVIDLSDCTFIDSSCVRVLVSVARETEEADPTGSPAWQNPQGREAAPAVGDPLAAEVGDAADG